jgi:hypothetical protein
MRDVESCASALVVHEDTTSTPFSLLTMARATAYSVRGNAARSHDTSCATSSSLR